MSNIQCTYCGKELSVPTHQTSFFCTYCGTKITTTSDAQQIEMLVAKALEHKNPVHIHQALTALDEQYPNQLCVKRALLLQGRLHERSSKTVDFSVIHCYLLDPFLEPEVFSKAQKQSFCEELMHGKNLEVCLNLAPNKDLFLKQYYQDISLRFITLFLEGSTKYMKTFFGFSFSKSPAKALARPCATMIERMLNCTALENYRFVLARAFYDAYLSLYKIDDYIIPELQSNIQTLNMELPRLYV